MIEGDSQLESEGPRLYQDAHRVDFTTGQLGVVLDPHKDTDVLCP
jgi:hypothetical protein